MFLSHAAGIRLPSKSATGENFCIENVISSSPKKIAGDTRNNWVTMMVVTHNRYNCLRKKIYIDVLLQTFHDLERFGFKFREFNFALNTGGEKSLLPLGGRNASLFFVYHDILLSSDKKTKV